MSTKILIKRSTTSGAVPTTSDLAVGELAINTTDKRIFTNNSGTIVELGTTPSTQAVTGNATVGGTFSVVGAVSVADFTATGTVNLTGATTTVAAPTADSHAATKLYVDTEINSILDGAPAALDTLNEIAAAINDDANVYTTLTNSIATKLPLAGGTMTGSIDMGANKVTSTATPTTASDLTRKAYVDGLYQSTVDAETSAANALASEQAAATSASNAATSASTAATQASNASSSATAAASSATQASNSATSSANSATAAASSATAASNSATTASGHADNAAASATAAASSATAAAQSATDAANALDTKVSKSGDTMTGNLNFGDNDKAQFGASNDLQIYHDGTYTRIIDSGITLFRSDDWRLQSQPGAEQMIRAVGDGAVSISYNNEIKLETTSTGIDVQGTVTADGLTVDGTLGSLSLSSDGARLSMTRASANYVQASSVGGSLNFTTNGTTNRQTIANNGDISFYEDTGTTPKFFWDASAEALGIGTTIPNAKLRIQNDNSTVPSLIVRDGGTPSAAMVDVSSSATGSAFYIDSSGNVGIGTSSPSEKLHIKGGSGDHYKVRLEDASGFTGLKFGQFGTNGQISSPTALEFCIGASDTERARIDSSGNLLVGKTSDVLNNVGCTLGAAGYVTGSRNNGAPLSGNRKGSDGDILALYKDGSTVGSIGTRAGYLKIGSGDAGLLFNYTGNNIFPENIDTGVANDGNIDLGATGARFKDLYLSGGVYLGGTGSANHFKDYEEGTWTPTGTSNITINSIQNADYVKKGDSVTVNAWIKVNPTSGSFIIGGLPFSTSGRTACVVVNQTQEQVIVNQALGTTIYGYSSATAGTNDDMFISVTYIV